MTDIATIAKGLTIAALITLAGCKAPAARVECIGGYLFANGGARNGIVQVIGDDGKPVRCDVEDDKESGP